MVEIGSDGRFLSPGERVVAVINYHPVTLLPQLAGSIAAFLVGLWASADGQAWGTVVVLAAIVFFIGAFLDYRLQKLILTDKRLMEVKGVVTRTVSNMKLSALTDLRYERSVPGLLFGWGTMIVETAGQNQALSRVPYVPNPDRFYGNVARLIF